MDNFLVLVIGVIIFYFLGLIPLGPLFDYKDAFSMYGYNVEFFRDVDFKLAFFLVHLAFAIGIEFLALFIIVLMRKNTLCRGPRMLKF